MTRTLALLVLATGLVLSTPVIGIAQWTAVGSTGTVDDADRNIYDTNGALVKIRNSVPLPATLNIRYNVVKTEGIGSKPPTLGIFYRAEGTGARVIARLRRVSFFSTQPETVMTVESEPGISTGWVFHTVVPSCEDDPLDFQFNAYYVDVILIKTSADDSPAVLGVRVQDHSPC